MREFEESVSETKQRESRDSDNTREGLERESETVASVIYGIFLK